MDRHLEETATLTCGNCGSLLLGDSHIIEYPDCDACRVPLRIRIAIVVGLILSIPISIILIPLLFPPLLVWSYIQTRRINHG